MAQLGFEPGWLDQEGCLDSVFQKTSESASPGYYAVTLDRVDCVIDGLRVKRDQRQI